MTHIVRRIKGIEREKNAYENGKKKEEEKKEYIYNTDKSKWQVFFF